MLTLNGKPSMPWFWFTTSNNFWDVSRRQARHRVLSAYIGALYHSLHSVPVESRNYPDKRNMNSSPSKANSAGIAAVDESEDAVAFLNAVRESNLLSNQIHPKLLYRGVSDTKHELIPSAFRTDETSKRKLIECSSVEGNRNFSLTQQNQFFLEFNVVRAFYTLADIQGYDLPSLSGCSHKLLTSRDADLEFSQLTCWPDEFLPIVGLAQHYGLPTRLLDWTIDPLIALYFSAIGGSDSWIKKKSGTDIKTTHIGVYRFASSAVKPSLISKSTNTDRVVEVHVPRGKNSNLAAQKGVFTLCKVNNIESERMPLNDIYWREIRDPNLEYKPFKLFTLKIEEAPVLLLLLHRLGYNAAKVFPGLDGVKQSIEWLGRLENFTEVEDRLNQLLRKSSV